MNWTYTPGSKEEPLTPESILQSPIDLLPRCYQSVFRRLGEGIKEVVPGSRLFMTPRQVEEFAVSYRVVSPENSFPIPDIPIPSREVDIISSLQLPGSYYDNLPRGINPARDIVKKLGDEVEGLIDSGKAIDKNGYDTAYFTFLGPIVEIGRSLTLILGPSGANRERYLIRGPQKVNIYARLLR